MEVLSLSSARRRGLRTPIVTLGSFDGVHLAHQAILREVIERARKTEGDSLAVTFTPHPKTVLAPGADPFLLTLPDEKLNILEEMGLDFAVLLPFTAQLQQMAAETFVEKIFVTALNVRMVVIGHDHAFGQGRRGGLKTLEILGARHHFEVVAIDPILFQGAPISSTRIRRSLRSGKVSEAAQMLGRPYGLKGSVVPGEGRGRGLHYPTANLSVEAKKLIPADGVYAVISPRRTVELHGLINIGRRPTFGKSSRTLEIHFFDFEESLYGQTIEIQFIEKIRDERRFTDVSQLKEQISKDEEVARRLLTAR